MGSVLPFLKARFAERSSRVQLVVLVLLGLMSAGYLSMEQIQAWGTQAVALVAVSGPLLGILFPDKNHAIVDAAQVDAAVDLALNVATEAAEAKAGVEATEVAKVVGGFADKLGL